MSVRGIGDGYAFQRLMWLFVGTVIVPTILLALYGVMAIRNQNAWLLQQIQTQQTARLQDSAVVLFRRVDLLEQGVRRAPLACGDSQNPPCGAPGVSRVWVWEQPELPPDTLTGLGLPSATVDGTVWFNPTDGGGPIGVDGTVAWQIDIHALEKELDRYASDRFGDGMGVRLVGLAPGPATPVDEMFTAFGERPVDLPLQRPLSAWRLTAHWPNGSPAVTQLERTRWVGPLALAILVTLVLTGAGIALGSAAREIRLSRLQTDFVSSVSHELRTPLTSIRLFVETLQSGRLDDPERIDECLEMLGQETERLSRMIERVLGWARMEAGRRVYELEPVAVPDLVDDALRALQSQNLMADTTPEIEVELPPSLPLLVADRDAIVEALINLLQNAVKYTPVPQKIRVQAVKRGRQVGITVLDNGPGVAHADRSRIFEKFYQANTFLSSPTQHGADRGSGLGLSIVRAVVRGHGGRVELKTELGQGSRFTLWLPCQDRPR